MRKRILPMLAAIALFVSLLPAALAEPYQFPAIHAGIILPDGVFQTVLTPENLQENEAFIQSRGGNAVSWAADFAARGVLLQAYDTENNRVLVITALPDVDGQRLFDINEHPSDVRTRYRLSHGPQGAYTILGYKYDSVSWKNFPGIGRFLQLRYAYRQGGDVEHRGYQRRTIRNGHTITVDLQVFGRALSGKDNTALNKVFDTFTFSQILPLPPLPISLEESESAPVETSRANFTLKGKTKPGASLRAVLMSFATSATRVFEAQAGKSGNYSLPIELPGEDVYVMTLTVQAEGFDDLSRSYNIRYQKGLIPTQIASAPPEELPGDQFTLAGRTLEGGVRATLSVNGVETAKNVARDGSFSFTFDTAVEGAYDIRLVLTKKGLQDRVFQYNAVRALSPQAREELLRKDALRPAYTELTSNPDTYDGKMLEFEGIIIEKSNATDTWVTRLALNKTDAGFSDIILLTSEADPGFALNDRVRVFGRMDGMNVSQDSAGAQETLPRLSLSLMAAP